MQIYRVIDDGSCVLTTADELAALRLLRKLAEKHNVTAAWVDDEELK